MEESTYDDKDEVGIELVEESAETSSHVFVRIRLI